MLPATRRPVATDGRTLGFLCPGTRALRIALVDHQTREIKHDAQRRSGNGGEFERRCRSDPAASASARAVVSAIHRGGKRAAAIAPWSGPRPTGCADIGLVGLPARRGIAMMLPARAGNRRRAVRECAPSRPIGFIQPQYLPALAQSRLLRLQTAHLLVPKPPRR